jgi:hypothetical protein
VELELNEAHPLLVSADYVSLVGNNIDAIEKMSEASKNAGLEADAEKN